MIVLMLSGKQQSTVVTGFVLTFQQNFELMLLTESQLMIVLDFVVPYYGNCEMVDMFQLQRQQLTTMTDPLLLRGLEKAATPRTHFQGYLILVTDDSLA